MDKVLILTDRMDAHARAVAECLARKGAMPIRWIPEEFIFRQKGNQRIQSNGKHSILIEDENQNILDLVETDVVWYRRVGFPVIPPTIDPQDYQFISAENQLYMKSLWLTLGESAKWVNPFSSFDKSNSKVLQLREAARIGLKIPESLITNDKKAIINFIQENSPQKTIYKTFSPAMWEENNTIISNYTTAISHDILPDEATIALTPGIYQKEVKKKHEVRITFFGDEYVAVKIHNAEELDWRICDKNKLSSIPVPDDIVNKCKLLMEKLGIVFGCFDFIVTPQEEYYFLEVNEMGQFLWIEKTLPELHLLDKFCDFLLSREGQQKNSVKKKDSIKLNEIASSQGFQQMTREDLVKQKILI